MDDLVRAAMVRWPDVPDVYGWLGLTARGEWRLRGEPIDNAALRAFIQRNYQPDEQGRWFFQNGPQRVFVRCERAPLVARLQGTDLLLPMDCVVKPQQVWLDGSGDVWFLTAQGPASLDDRDLDCWLESVRYNDALCDEAVMLSWLEGGEMPLSWNAMPIRRLGHAQQELGFIANPRPLSRDG